MISINTNLSAMNVATNLNRHYSQLQTSTQRLSSGLRINGAADDAAGLAIRELMRADIAVLNQGTRNANDAISMLQVFDGALSVIDEKLIRMKELAEQAATGTYDSTQRLMIDSEFQAMASEINRIARATDFNGIKLLDGKGLDGANAIRTREVISSNPDDPDAPDFDVNASTTKMVNKVWNGAEATQIGGWDLSGITQPDKLAALTTITLNNANVPKIGNDYLMITPNGIDTNLPVGSELNMSWTPYEAEVPPGSGNIVKGCVWNINGATSTGGGVTVFGDATGFTYSGPDANGNPVSAVSSLVDENGNGVALTTPGNLDWIVQDFPTFTTNVGTVEANRTGNVLTLEIDLGNNNIISGRFNIPNGEDRSLASVSLDLTSREIRINPDPNDPDTPGIPDLFSDKVKIHFGTGNDSAEDYYYINKHDVTTAGLGLADVDIKTQDNAQNALVQINDAIVIKDGIRAEYGALQNRFENTVTNLRVQAENLQASESRISDTDIALEMTQFVRNQILTQSAVAMLTQANSMPQMVMRLIG